MVTIRDLQAKLTLVDSNFTKGIQAAHRGLKSITESLTTVVSKVATFEQALATLQGMQGTEKLIYAFSVAFDSLSAAIVNMPRLDVMRNRFELLSKSIVDLSQVTAGGAANITQFFDAFANIDPDSLPEPTIKVNLDLPDRVPEVEAPIIDVLIDTDSFIEQVHDAIAQVEAMAPKLSLIVNETDLERSINETIRRRGGSDPSGNWFQRVSILVNQRDLVNSINTVISGGNFVPVSIGAGTAAPAGGGTVTAVGGTTGGEGDTAGRNAGVINAIDDLKRTIVDQLIPAVEASGGFS